MIFLPPEEHLYRLRSKLLSFISSAQTLWNSMVFRSCDTFWWCQYSLLNPQLSFFEGDWFLPTLSYSYNSPEGHSTCSSVGTRPSHRWGWGTPVLRTRVLRRCGVRHLRFRCRFDSRLTVFLPVVPPTWPLFFFSSIRCTWYFGPGTAHTFLFFPP